jgi:hypothetical protein
MLPTVQAFSLGCVRLQQCMVIGVPPLCHIETPSHRSTTLPSNVVPTAVAPKCIAPVEAVTFHACVHTVSVETLRRESDGAATRGDAFEPLGAVVKAPFTSSATAIATAFVPSAVDAVAQTFNVDGYPLTVIVAFIPISAFDETGTRHATARTSAIPIFFVLSINFFSFRWSAIRIALRAT